MAEACGSSVDPGDPGDYLRGSWTNPEDYRERQLTTYPDEATAQAYVDAILDLYRACPSQDTPDGQTIVNRVVDGDLGDSSGVGGEVLERGAELASVAAVGREKVIQECLRLTLLGAGVVAPLRDEKFERALDLLAAGHPAQISRVSAE